MTISKAAEILATVPDEETTDLEEYAQYLLDNVKLPAFYTFPEPNPTFIIKVVADENSYHLEVRDEAGQLQEISSDKDVIAVYDQFSERNKDIIFEGDFSVFPGVRTFLGSSLTVDYAEESGKTGGRILVSHTRSDEIWLAKRNWLSFLETVVAYEENPEDFYSSYYYVANHPAFWYRQDTERWAHDWETDYSHKVWSAVGKSDKGEVYIMLEAGQAIQPDRTSHYHDLRLDVYAPTFEEAYVKLAAKVHKFFDIFGDEIPDVEYEKSNLEKLLDERLKEVDETGQ